MKIRNVFFASICVLAVMGSLAFKPASTMFTPVTYIDPATGWACYESASNWDCTTTGTGPQCTAYDPNYGTNEPAYLKTTGGSNPGDCSFPVFIKLF